MYFYNSILLISNILILTVQTALTAKGLGISACNYNGYINENCNLPAVEVSGIPKECTSIVFDGVFVDLNYHIFADSCECGINQVVLDYLDKVLQSSLPVYLYYGYYSQSEWTQVLACETCDGGINSLDEMKGLEAFLNEHKGITGVILSAFENDQYSIEFPEFTENLKKYLEVMKTSFPQLEIGIQIKGRFLIDQYTNPKVSWLDIKVIEAVTDFFIIKVSFLNDCTDESLYNTGVSPMHPSNYTIYSMDNIKSILPKSSIPKEKLYFKYRLNPTSDPNDSHTSCDLTIQEMCENPSGTCLYCSDTMESLNDKGKFAFENGVGFIASDVDTNDPTNKCKCEKPFGSFYALLNGFQRGITKPCDSFPRKTE